ncbi:unnamed protein product [Vitrella brassicaformis CCMP3155]|uniref:PRELI/MSF1 domain-containing protein n=2 Tax=Vitrella brassicaformis TaxID=1169539 RepID=A0A0G4EJS1_VITBC|nr:unnamed protein product [Vitrella brassicaformis CCMP3155]|eukprot:CEL96759.1 unnamed protein product [Vitrella brassicaformis CCMP3155]
MTTYVKEHTFEHDWGTVTSAHWRKYPNSLQPHVVQVDTVNREIDPDNMRFRTRRLLSLKYRIPSWVQMLFGFKLEGLAVEEADCDLLNGTLVLRSHNHTFRSLFRCDETCTYRVHPDNPQWTLYRQEACYHVMGFGKTLGKRLEKMAIQSAGEKSDRGIEVVSALAQQIQEHDPLPPFTIPTRRPPDNTQTDATADNGNSPSRLPSSLSASPVPSQFPFFPSLCLASFASSLNSLLGRRHHSQSGEDRGAALSAWWGTGVAVAAAAGGLRARLLSTGNAVGRSMSYALFY